MHLYCIILPLKVIIMPSETILVVPGFYKSMWQCLWVKVTPTVLWEPDGSVRVGGSNITTYQKRILNDINTVQRDKAYKFEDIIPLAMNRDLWKALCNSM